MMATLIHMDGKRCRVMLGERVVGPVMPERQAKHVLRWLNEGGLDDFVRLDFGMPALGKILQQADGIWEAIKGLKE